MNSEMIVPGYNLFLSTLAAEYDPNTLELVSFAYVASKYGHAQQKRDDGGRYFDHPKAAAWIYINELGGRDPLIICDLLLHDVKEDAYLLSIYRIKLNFGMEVALDVLAVTKLPKGKETPEANVQRIIDRGHRAIITKLCDRLHNVRSLGGCTPEKREKQIKETKEVVMSPLIDALYAAGGDCLVHASQLEKKLNSALAVYETKQ
jgi:(p)ppGpp synthase/HD superfamily hydrolase